MNVKLSVVVSFPGKLRMAATPMLEFADTETDVFPAETAISNDAFEDGEVERNSADARSGMEVNQLIDQGKSNHPHREIAKTFGE